MESTPPFDVGIVGAGIIGLASAMSLAQAGYRVAIIARNTPGDTTTQWSSPWAGAAILPSLSDDPTDMEMQRVSLRQYWTLAYDGTETGVQASLPFEKTVKVSEYWDEKETRGNPWYSGILEFRPLSPSELPTGATGGNTYVSTTVNPDLLLLWLQKKLESQYGVPFIKETVPSFSYAMRRIRCRAIINASGLGAKRLARDGNVISIRGQTMLVNNGAFRAGMDREIRIRRGKEYTYTIPRMSSGGIIIGGIEDEQNTSMEVDDNVRLDIIRRVNIMTGDQLQGLALERDVIRDIVGFRPGRKGGYRIEREGNVIHAYGFGGAGYRYSWGVASEVTKLVDELGLSQRQKI